MTFHTSEKSILPNAEFRSFDSIDAVDSSCLALFKKGSAFLSREYFVSIEKATPPGMHFHYVFRMVHGKAKSFYYFHVINLASKELGQIINLAPYSKMLPHFSTLFDSILFGKKKEEPSYLLACGNMCISGDFGIIRGVPPQETFDFLPQAIEFVKTVLEKKGRVIAFVVKDFESASDLSASILKKKNYSRLAMDPIMKMKLDPEWKTFDDYLDALSSKYRLRYNNARKKISKLEIRELNAAEIRNQHLIIDQLYKAVQLKSPVRLVKSDYNYLISLAENMGEKFHFIAYFEKELMVAFLCGIADGDHYEAHHIGIDYHINKSHALYLNILYEFIRLAIKSGAKELSFGRTSLEMKTTVGAVAVPYNAYIRLNNLVLNRLIKLFLSETPNNDWTPRNPFKQED